MRKLVIVASLLVVGFASSTHVVAADARYSRSTAPSLAARAGISAEYEGVSFPVRVLPDAFSTGVDVVAYQDGNEQVLRKRPGRRHTTPVQIDTGVFSQRHVLFSHWINVEQGQANVGRDLTIIWRDNMGGVVQRLNFVRAWISNVSIDADGNATLTFEHEGMQMLRP